MPRLQVTLLSSCRALVGSVELNGAYAAAWDTVFVPCLIPSYSTPTCCHCAASYADTVNECQNVQELRYVLQTLYPRKACRTHSLCVSLLWLQSLMHYPMSQTFHSTEAAPSVSLIVWNHSSEAVENGIFYRKSHWIGPIYFRGFTANCEGIRNETEA